MAITNGYCTLAELKAHMGKISSDTTNDSLFELSIESASREIDERITGRKDIVVYKATTLTESKVIAGMGMNADGLMFNYMMDRIYVPDKITTITEVNDAGTILTVNEDYLLGDNFIKKVGTFSNSIDGVLVTGTMSSDTIPTEIKNLCKNMAAVLTGMSTKTVTDAVGNTLEINLRNYPDWVIKKLKAIGMVVL